MELELRGKQDISITLVCSPKQQARSAMTDTESVDKNVHLYIEGS